MIAARPLLSAALLVTLILWLSPPQDAGKTHAASPSFQSDLYPSCTQFPLNPALTGQDEAESDYHLYLPLIFTAPTPPPPPCTVYCGLALADDPYRPASYQTYFADEFDCNQLLDYWAVQPQMTLASYSPPLTGQVEVSNGTLKVAIPGQDVSFPYLYMVDDLATTYDVAHTGASGAWAPRGDWLPDEGDFRITLRVRFAVEQLGEHRISIYADATGPATPAPCSM
jgi:hypothetical protein